MNAHPGLSRRQFVTKTVLAGAAFAGLSLPHTGQAKSAAPKNRLIDVNITLAQWPMRRLPLDDPAELETKLAEHRVEEAWACSFEALLQRDLAAVNSRLARVCHSSPRKVFVPFGAINPAQTQWRDDLRRCVEEHRMPGVRLYPNYHGYPLDAVSCAELLSECAGRGLIVQIAATLEDIRLQHPRMKCDPVDVKPLPGVLKNAPELKLILLNWNRAANSKVALDLARAGKAQLDIATQEGVAGISNLLAQVPDGAVLFGSHAPYYYFESALLKLRESDLTTSQSEAVKFGNAEKLKLTLARSK